MCNSQENQLKECATNNTFYRLKFSFAGGLPDPEVDIFFIVPTLVRIALPERKDIITASKRSEERRVGKECRSRGRPSRFNKKVESTCWREV